MIELKGKAIKPQRIQKKKQVLFWGAAQHTCIKMGHFNWQNLATEIKSWELLIPCIDSFPLKR